MVHYLRDERNRTIIECETTKKLNKDVDLHSYIDVAEYSDLLHFNSEKFNEIKWDFDSLHNLRRDWFEGFYDCSVDDFVKDNYSRVANKYSLNYVTD